VDGAEPADVDLQGRTLRIGLLSDEPILRTNRA